MARVSRVLLPFVLTGIVLLSDLSWVESSNKNTTTENAVGLASASTPTPTPTQKPERSSPVAEQKTPDEKSPSIIQMLEGREHDLILWVSIAIIAFAIGWILGGNYYLRRDRARSKRLRF
jgi:hypothetical protein